MCDDFHTFPASQSPLEYFLCISIQPCHPLTDIHPTLPRVFICATPQPSHVDHDSAIVVSFTVNFVIYHMILFPTTLVTGFCSVLTLTKQSAERNSIENVARCRNCCNYVVWKIQFSDICYEFSGFSVERELVMLEILHDFNNPDFKQTSTPLTYFLKRGIHNEKGENSFH